MNKGVIHIKLSLAAIFMASLTSFTSLYAGATLNEDGNLSISVKKLKKAHEAGELTLKSGQKFKVVGEMTSDKLPDDKETLTSQQPSNHEHRFIRFITEHTATPSTEPTYV